LHAARPVAHKGGMKYLPLFAPLALAACASTPGVHAPVDMFEYGAISHDPFWLVSIGDDRIVLTRGPAGGRADGELTTTEFRRTLPVTNAAGTRRWESGKGTDFISLEAKAGPCTTGGRTYADKTRVLISGQELIGCGGPEVRSAGQ
jgi:uncharacterized membrane protein